MNDNIKTFKYSNFSLALRIGTQPKIGNGCIQLNKNDFDWNLWLGTFYIAFLPWNLGSLFSLSRLHTSKILSVAKTALPQPMQGSIGPTDK